MYKKYFKRLIDFTLSFIGLLVFSPIFILVLIALSFANDGKPFFYQIRPGKNGILFRIIKFKTMNDRKDANGQLLPDADRLTSLGSFIRKTSIDEMPQLINVMLGDMSLVGPRPLLPQYLPLYNSQQRKRHLVRPGITGWAQVNGRNAISWAKKFELDIWYVENVSFKTDCKVFFTTFIRVIKSDGVNQDGQATAEPFNGNN